MENKKTIKISLSTVICLIIIFILLLALVGVLFYFNFSNKNNSNLNEFTSSNQISNTVKNESLENKTNTIKEPSTSSNEINQQNNITSKTPENNNRNTVNTNESTEYNTNLTNKNQSSLNNIELINLNSNNYLGMWYETETSYTVPNANTLNIKNISNNKLLMDLYITRTANFNNFEATINSNSGTFEAITENGPSKDNKESKISGSIILKDNSIRLSIGESNVLYLNSGSSFDFEYKDI